MDRATKRRLKQEAKQRKKEERARKKAGRQPSVILKELGNLPNMLTMGRILVIPFFVWFTYEADPFYSLAAAAIFAIASITDVVDGFLARRWNMITVTGKLLDPLADKLIVTAAMVMMTRLGRIPAWVVIVLLSRELLTRGVFRATMATRYSPDEIRSRLKIPEGPGSAQKARADELAKRGGRFWGFLKRVVGRK